MTYKVTRNQKYDFVGQSYASIYPNLHKYPATMIPQIGLELFKELNIKKGKLLDPYCGSGSSFAVGLDCGLKEMHGFDINPLAILISRTKFTKVNLKTIKSYKQRLRNKLYEFIKQEENLTKIKMPNFYNRDFWFSKNVLQNLSVIKYFLDKITNKDIRRMFFVPFSETVRECSYTRNHEFKLYKMKPEDVLHFNPDVFNIYFYKLNKIINIYEKYYYPKLNNLNIAVDYKEFKIKKEYYDIVLTSPPYGDSRTTVAYGQFSLFANEWFGIKYARQIDIQGMGGKLAKDKYDNGIISDYINEIRKRSWTRASQVSSFYFDLEKSIQDVAQSVSKKGKVIYIVGNRRVKNIQLPTDQFVAERFEGNGFKHLFTYERLLGNKVMPLKNSPTNQKGMRRGTMTKEYIVVCEK